MERLIFHVDVNSAFLSWEAASRVKAGEPDLREIPSAVGGDPRTRTGIIVAKSIPAKKYGVQITQNIAIIQCEQLQLRGYPLDKRSLCQHTGKCILHNSPSHFPVQQLQ